MEPELLLLGIGISPHKNDGVLRFEKYCKAFNLNYKVLGDGKLWRGGSMSDNTGGGQKLLELYDEIKNMDNKLIVLCDTFDLFPMAGKKEILNKYYKLCQNDTTISPNTKKIIVSSEVGCWPDENLRNKYPVVDTKYKFLNSGCVMGFRDDIYEILNKREIKVNEDDQLFFSLEFLNKKNIILDYRCEIFQALYAVKEDILVHKNRVYNKYTNSYPVFIHGNGPSKLFLNHLENYLEPDLNLDYSYTLNNITPGENNPKIFMALYVNSNEIEKFENFLSNIDDINYDNKLIYVYDKNTDTELQNELKSIGYNYKHSKKYVFEDFLNSDCEYYFLLEQQCIITNKNTLHELVSYIDNTRRIISPLLHGKNSYNFTNYWGAIDRAGYYVRADDYLDIINYNRRGFWNAPHVNGAILMKKEIIQNFNLEQPNKFSNTDNDMALSYNIRNNTLFMYMVNFNKYGHIMN